MPKKNPAQKNLEPFAWAQLTPAPVIGVDEVGRGCLAGPVFAAAVVLQGPPEHWLELTDSKLLSEARREAWAARIWESCLVGLGFATVEEIASLNILQASLLAMDRAVKSLSLSSGHILVDGNQRIPGWEAWAQTTLVKGDLRAQPVAAASIVAKVARDRKMRDLAELYPEYGFEKHKGYCTANHKQAIAEWGPCLEHRKLFGGVREHWSHLRPGPRLEL